MEGVDLTLWASCKECHTCYAARPKAVTDGQGDIILGTDVQDLIPVGVCKVLYMIQQAQLQQKIILSQHFLAVCQKAKPLLIWFVYDEICSKPHLPILHGSVVAECQFPRPMVRYQDAWSIPIVAFPCLRYIETEKGSLFLHTTDTKVNVATCLFCKTGVEAQQVDVEDCRSPCTTVQLVKGR